VLFDVQVHELGDRLVLAPVGELDLASAPRLRTRAVQAVTSGHRDLVIDLSGVDFADSVGAGTLVAIYKRVRALDGSLVLARPEPQVRRVLELAGIDRILAVHDDLDAAARASAAR
jgi:anti-anti-sigma factor